MIYVFQHPSREEYVEVNQNVDQEHVYFDESGLQWKRVYTAPKIIIYGNKDPFDSKDYVNTTRDKKGTVGDLLDRSKELSEKRKQLAGGVDPVQEKYFKEYSEKRKGRKHPKDPSLPKKIKKKGIEVDLS